MSSGVNKAILIGTVVKDPIFRVTQKGVKVIYFILVTVESWQSKKYGERRQKTEYHNIVIFDDPLASVAQKVVRKGVSLYVEGSLQTRTTMSYVNGIAGSRDITEIVLKGYNCTLRPLEKEEEENDE